MNIESNEQVLILRGDSIFKKGELFHWKQCLFGKEKGLWVFRTANDQLINAYYNEIFVEVADIVLGSDLDQPLVEALFEYINFQPTTFQIIVN